MELSALLSEAEAAAPNLRIQWRDRIAAHGAQAIDAVRPWLASPVLAAFAVRVIERAGTNGDLELATQVLRSARAIAPPSVKGDIDWALHQFRARSQPVAPPPAPTAVRRTRPLLQERPYLAAVVPRRAR